MVWESELQKDLDSLKNANVGEIAELLKVISNPTRFKIIMLLFKGDYCVCEYKAFLFSFSMLNSTDHTSEQFFSWE